ncbi:MAG TPA: Pvc16 family protein [Solirubrobacteraceae bacterium]|jgi:hypothetical protein|nr:Pvc16 family protein [Solirubrobacteraceae bacterium]
MGLVIDVPLNTALADLDEGLRALLKQELGHHGFEGVDISFEAPSREWSGKLTGPTVSLYLYDLREAAEQTNISGGEHRGSGGATVTPPDLRLETTYAVTAWSKAIEDEHRLLSQVLSILHSYRRLPADLLEGRLSAVGPIETVLGRPMQEKADFWTAVGGTYKPSIDFAVRLSIASGAVFVRGPEVRTQTIRTAALDGPRATMVELYRFGGLVHDQASQPINNVWVTMPESGAWTSTDSRGRFVFDRVRPGLHRLVARTVDGAEVAATVSVPGEHADLVIQSPHQPSAGGRRKRA